MGLNSTLENIGVPSPGIIGCIHLHGMALTIAELSRYRLSILLYQQNYYETEQLLRRKNTFLQMLQLRSKQHLSAKAHKKRWRALLKTSVMWVMMLLGEMTNNKGQHIDIQASLCSADDKMKASVRCTRRHGFEERGRGG